MEERIEFGRIDEGEYIVILMKTHEHLVVKCQTL